MTIFQGVQKDSTYATTRFTAMAALYAFSGGAIALLGWALNIPRLTDWNNSGISMFPNTAICAVLSAATLFLLNKKDSRLPRLIARILASMVVVTGGLTLVEHVLGANFGIDTVLFERDWG